MFTWGMEGGRSKKRGISKGHEEILEVMDVFILFTVQWFHKCICGSKINKWYTLNRCNLFFVNYFSVKLLIYHKSRHKYIKSFFPIREDFYYMGFLNI